MLASVLYPTFVLGGLGAALSLILLVAARKFAVYEDPLIAAVEDALPNANCGACGQAGCHAFAENLVKSRDPAMFCPPGGTETAQKVATLLGMEASDQVAPVAVVMCRGNKEAASFVGLYEGLESCRAATLVDGPTKLCPYGCVGLGSCVAACDYDAIHIVEGIALVEDGSCVGCGACVKACPKGIIRMGPRATRVFVGCVSHDTGKAVRGYCEVGCIGCKRCVKACDFDAMQFDDNLARVDHEKCTACGACIAACGRDIIFGVGLSEEAHARAYPSPEELARQAAEKKAKALAAAKAKAAAKTKARPAASKKAAEEGGSDDGSGDGSGDTPAAPNNPAAPVAKREKEVPADADGASTEEAPVVAKQAESTEEPTAG